MTKSFAAPSWSEPAWAHGAVRNHAGRGQEVLLVVQRGVPSLPQDIVVGLDAEEVTHIVVDLNGLIEGNEDHLVLQVTGEGVLTVGQ